MDGDILTGQVLQHSGQVHGRAGTHTRRVLALLQVPAIRTRIMSALAARVPGPEWNISE